MAADGRFTYEDLYAGQSSNYHHRSLPQVSSSITTNFISSQLEISTRTTTTIISTTYLTRLITSTNVHSNTKLNKLADIIPFTYLYWILLVLAILFTITLIIVFIYYCRTFIKNYTTRRGSFTSFYKRGTINPLINRHQNSQTKTKSIIPPALHGNSLTPPCPSHSLKSLDDQLYQRNSDTNNSPQIARHDIFLKEPLSTFSNCTSNLSSTSASRLSARSSDPPLKVEQLFESQRASMALNDEGDVETKNHSMIVDIN